MATPRYPISANKSNCFEQIMVGEAVRVVSEEHMQAAEYCDIGTTITIRRA